ncbi:MAG: hypothetical protein V1750_01280 [Acidobacteriota bacterium]
MSGPRLAAATRLATWKDVLAPAFSAQAWRANGSMLPISAFATPATDLRNPPLDSREPIRQTRQPMAGLSSC